LNAAADDHSSIAPRFEGCADLGERQEYMLVEAFIAQPATRRAPLHQARHTLPFRPNNLFNSLKDAQIVIESGASATTSGVRILRSAIVRRRRRPSHPEEARLWHEPVQYKVSHSCWYQNVRPVPSSSGIGLKAKDRSEPALRVPVPVEAGFEARVGGVGPQLGFAPLLDHPARASPMSGDVAMRFDTSVFGPEIFQRFRSVDGLDQTKEAPAVVA